MKVEIFTDNYPNYFPMLFFKLCINLFKLSTKFGRPYNMAMIIPWIYSDISSQNSFRSSLQLPVLLILYQHSCRCCNQEAQC